MLSYTAVDLNVQQIDLEAVARVFIQDKAEFSKDVSPIYLRPPDVSQPKNKPRQLTV